ncbi:MAG: carnitine dehydratase [Deltaproteobacteria bacterium HGW-Deltaproteobacteria-12]|jgi:crotonobetainyl-CoA:carnitine CoA-transferase CaiB-like acyl-CoA transferase|nr:MAG: carnitine dehydratase [Deltaproteobacteria bacterium HGW-Deltaproteobacteria-12]
MDKSDVPRPYEGLKVLDFGRALAAPYFTQLLSDMGATVYKVEKPGRGADERWFEPIHKNQSGYFMMLNRGKKSIVLDLKKPEAIVIAKELVKKMDVVVQNFKPGVMDKLGLGFGELKKINPQIIMVSISIFGGEGPKSKLPGYDIIAQAASGLMWMTGNKDGAPMRSGTSIGDVNCGTHAGTALGGALWHRMKTGEGSYIDLSLRDCLSSVMETAFIRYTMTDGKDKPIRSGNHHATMAPYGVFNGPENAYFAVGILSPAIWERFCNLIGKPELIQHTDFGESSSRARNLAATIKLVEDGLKSLGTVENVLRHMAKASVPCAKVMDIDDIVHDEQFLLRKMLVEINDPIFGPIKVPGAPFLFKDMDTGPQGPPPKIGEHTDEILRTELGYEKDRIDNFCAQKVAYREMIIQYNK